MIRGKLIGDQAQTIRHAPDSEVVQGRIRTLRAEPTSSAASQFHGYSSFYPLAQPSGALMVVIETEGGYGRRGRVSDGRRPLEERIDEVFGLVARLEQAEAALERERAETQRRWRLEAERRERQARRVAEERACRQPLTEQAAAWAKQAELSAYLQAVEQAEVLPPARVQGWRTWVQAAGAALDPLSNGGLLDLARRVGQLQAGDLTDDEAEDR